MYKANSIQEESAREMTVLAVHPLKRPEIVTIRNDLSVLQDAVGGMIQVVYYKNILTRDHGKASDCLKCGKCEKICPQHLPIRKLLEQVAEEFEQA